MVRMDDKDRKIVEMLREDSRRPFTEIAEELGVTEATIRKRVESMEEAGVIEGYSVEVDPKKLGYETVTLLGLDVEPENLLEAAEEMVEIDEVKSVSTCTGDHMIMAEIWAKDNSHLGRIMSEEVGDIEGVKNLCPAIILEKIEA